MRVLLVEDHAMVARGIEAALADEDGLEVVGIAGTVDEGVMRFKPARSGRRRHGLSASPTAKARKRRAASGVIDGDAAVLLLTGADDPSVVSDALDSGCSGFVSKDRDVDDLVSAIRAGRARRRGIPRRSAVARAAARRPTSRASAPTSPRVSARCSRCSPTAPPPRRSASGLFLSLHTVRNHVRNILTKLHARTKLEAVVIAARAGLVDLRPDT